MNLHQKIYGMDFVNYMDYKEGEFMNFYHDIYKNVEFKIVFAEYDEDYNYILASYQVNCLDKYYDIDLRIRIMDFYRPEFSVRPLDSAFLHFSPSILNLELMSSSNGVSIVSRLSYLPSGQLDFDFKQNLSYYYLNKKEFIYADVFDKIIKDKLNSVSAKDIRAYAFKYVGL